MNKPPMKDTMVLWAFRYCLGRRSYAVGDCADYLIAYWKYIDGVTQKLIRHEIEEALENGNFGMDVDGRTWKNVLKMCPIVPYIRQEKRSSK